MQPWSSLRVGRLALSYTIPAVLIVLVLIATSGPPLLAQQPKTAAPPSSRPVTVGPFSLAVPAEWSPFDPTEAAELRRQYMVQSQEIYRQFAGADDPSKSVDLSAFHISGSAGSFILVAFSVPPTSDLIPLLKSQVGDKMAFGVREGYIRKYLGLVSVATNQLSGFYTKAIGNTGNLELAGGIEHKDLKNMVIQLTLLCPANWDEARATRALSSVLDSLVLRRVSTARSPEQQRGLLPTDTTTLFVEWKDLDDRYNVRQRAVSNHMTMSGGGKGNTGILLMPRAPSSDIQVHGAGFSAGTRAVVFTVPLENGEPGSELYATLGVGTIVALPDVPIRVFGVTVKGGRIEIERDGVRFSGTVETSSRTESPSAPTPVPQTSPVSPSTLPPTSQTLAYVSLQRVASESVDGRAARARVTEARAKGRGSEAEREEQARFESLVKPLLASLRLQRGVGVLLAQESAGIVWADKILDLTDALKSLVDKAPASQAAVVRLGGLGIVNIQRLASDSRLGKDSTAKAKAGSSSQVALQAEFQKRVTPVIAEFGPQSSIRMFLSLADAGIVWMDPRLDATTTLVSRLDAATHGQPGLAPWSPPPAVVAFIDIQTVAKNSRLGQESSAAMARLVERQKNEGTTSSGGRELQELQTRLQTRFQEALTPLLERECVARGVTLLFSRADAGIVDADAALDLTGPLVKALDSRSGAPPAPAALGWSAVSTPQNLEAAGAKAPADGRNLAGTWRVTQSTAGMDGSPDSSTYVYALEFRDTALTLTSVVNRGAPLIENWTIDGTERVTKTDEAKSVTRQTAKWEGPVLETKMDVVACIYKDCRPYSGNRTTMHAITVHRYSVSGDGRTMTIVRSLTTIDDDTDRVLRTGSQTHAAERAPSASSSGPTNLVGAGGVSPSPVATGQNTPLGTFTAQSPSDLLSASLNGDIGQVKSLLSAGADVNAKRTDGLTALLAAAGRGHTEVVKLLLAARADVNATRSNDGVTALMIASQNDHFEAVRLLLSAGPDVNARDRDGMTSLYMAAQDGHVPIVDLLLSAGADVQARRNDGATALMAASQSGHPEVVKRLVAARADPNATSSKGGVTALLTASEKGRIEVVNLLLSAGANPHARLTNGASALLLASQGGHVEVIRSLLAASADVTAKAANGATALLVASLNGHLEAVKLLVEAGADVNAATATGDTPLGVARDDSIIAFLKSRGATRKLPLGLDSRW